MRKLLAMSLVAACACGSSQSFQDQARDAMPDSTGVHMGAPSDSQQRASTNVTAQNQQDLVAGSSDWYKATVAFVVSINASTAWTLGVVETVTTTQPTSCSETSCTWGPGSGALDPNSYQLVVSKNADATSFDWHLDARSKAQPGSAFVTILHGNAVPSGIRHRGSGTFTIDLDAAATLSNHSTEHGNVVIGYSNVGPAHIEAHFNGVNDSSPNNAGQLGNAYYDFREQVSGGGDMEIAWHNLTTNDRTDIHSRWLTNGSGRADVTVVKTSGGVSLSNCWASAAASFATTFDTFGGGVESSCSISPAVPGTHINDPQ
ncbi:MAG: hypothetical protein ACJ78Y_12615 [Myxococcales bacterium]